MKLVCRAVLLGYQSRPSENRGLRAVTGLLIVFRVRV